MAEKLHLLKYIIYSQHIAMLSTREESRFGKAGYRSRPQSGVWVEHNSEASGDIF